MIKILLMFFPAILAVWFSEYLEDEKYSTKKMLYYFCFYSLLFQFISSFILSYIFNGSDVLAYVGYTNKVILKHILLSSVLTIIVPFIIILLKKQIKFKIKIPKKKLTKKEILKISKKWYKKYIIKNKEMVFKVSFFITFFIFHYLINFLTIKESFNILVFHKDISSWFFTTSYTLIVVLIIYLLPKYFQRISLIVSYILNILFFITQYMLINIKSEAFSVYELSNASEGLKFSNTLLPYINVYFIVVMILFILIMAANFYLSLKIKRLKERKLIKKIIIVVCVALAFYGIAYKSLGSYEENSWNQTNSPKYYYNNFVNSNKSLQVCGFYEYLIRDSYLFIKNSFDVPGTVEELENLIKKYKVEKEDNKMTGIFKDKNLIMIMMESIDNVVVNEEVMPTLNYMRKNGWDFTERYSSRSEGGSTIATEFSTLTGLFYTRNNISPISSYNINNMNIKTSIPSMFKNNGYIVSSIHENIGSYYNREELHKSFGFENRYFLYDISDNVISFNDLQLVDNDEFYKFIVPSKKEKFMSFVLTIEAHGPYENNGICEQDSKDGSERECFEYLASGTDEMLKRLLERLEKDKLLDDTVIILYTDHQAYTYNYTEEDLDTYKEIDENKNIKNLPFIIYSKDIKKKKYNDILVNDVDLVPTILNLFGIDYNPNYYVGTDLFANNHRNLIMFNESTWYDGNVYSPLIKDFENEESYRENNKYVKDKLNINSMLIYNYNKFVK